MGQPRINLKEGRKLVTLFVNFLVGISQFFTVTFLFVGWFWSIAWGGLIIIHSSKLKSILIRLLQLVIIIELVIRFISLIKNSLNIINDDLVFYLI